MTTEPARRTVSRVLVTAVIALTVLAHTGAHARAADVGELVRARASAADVAHEITNAELQREETESQIAAAEHELSTAVTDAQRIRHELRARAAELYIRHASTRLDLVMSAPNAVAGARASQLTGAVAQREHALAARLHDRAQELERHRIELGERRAALDEQIRSLEDLRSELERRVSRAVRVSRHEAVDTVATARTTGTDVSVWETFRECTFAYESGGDYAIVSPGGTYHGAWQFLPSTWNAVAGRMGRGDLVGVLPSVAAPTDQDAVAHQLWLESGNRPWGGRC